MQLVWRPLDSRHVDQHQCTLDDKGMFAKMTAIRQPRLLSVSAEHRIVIQITFPQSNSL